MPDNLCRFKAGIFQALGHPTRIAIIEVLATRARCPSAGFTSDLASSRPTFHSILRCCAKQIVIGRKEGNQVFYSLRDPILGRVLNLMRKYFQSNLKESLELLEDMKMEQNPSK